MTRMTPAIADRPHDDAEGADDVHEAARRIARFARTADPDALWPGLTERARVAAAREIERVTRLVLAGAASVPLDPDGHHAAYALGIAGHTTGMGPLLGRWIEDGRVDAADDARAVLARHLAHGRVRAARMEREGLPALDALATAGLAPVLLKGAHTGRVYFEEPGVRRMNDVDVLVSAAGVAQAESTLLGAGFHPDGAPHRPYKRDWLAPGVDPGVFSVERNDARSRWALELHASLDRVHHPGAVARLDALRDDTVWLVVAGRPLRGLGAVPLLLTLACHCAQELDGSRLLRLVELVRVIRAERAAGRLAWDDVLARLRRTGAARFAHPAFALAEQLAPGTVDVRVLALGRAESTWAARHTIDRLTPAGGSLDDRGVLRQLMWTRGPVSIAQRVLRSAWPASFLRPREVPAGWRIRLRRLHAGVLSLRAPDERA